MFTTTEIVIGIVVGLYFFWSVWRIWFFDREKTEYKPTKPTEFFFEPAPPSKEDFPTPPFESFDENSVIYCWAQVYGQWHLKIIPQPDLRASIIVYPDIPNWSFIGSTQAELLWRFTDRMHGRKPNDIKLHKVYIWQRSFDFNATLNETKFSWLDEFSGQNPLVNSSPSHRWVCAANL